MNALIQQDANSHHSTHLVLMSIFSRFHLHHIHYQLDVEKYKYANLEMID